MESGSTTATCTTNPIQDQQTTQPTRSSLVIIVATKITFNPTAGKRDNPKMSSCGESQPTPEWLVDNGATIHMIYDKSILHDVKPNSSQISVGDASSIEASCVGNVFLNTSLNDEPSILQDVLHVPPISTK